jgi:hypothetical protein
MATQPIQQSTATDEAYLGELAMKFRGTRDGAQRDAIAKEYAKTVKRLINSRHWSEMPSPEDQLPDDHMPKAFFEFWSK